MCKLWRRQRWVSKELGLSDGRDLRVVYCGRHTFDRGPDFRDALVVVADDLVRGDVEVHVRAGDWGIHGHQSDHYYDRVVLHVVWCDDGKVAVTASGRSLPLLALDKWTADKPEGSEGEGTETPEEGGMAVAWCPGRQFRGDDEMVRLIAELGGQRFAEKADALEAAMAVENREQAAYSAILEALGYSANREPFRALADALPWQVIAAACTGLDPAERVSLLEVLFLGSAGLLPCQRREVESMDGHVLDLELRWRELNQLWRITPLGRDKWQFGRVRPENYPPRRLAAAAHLLAPFVTGGMVDALIGVLLSEDPGDVAVALERVLTVPALGYWSTRHDCGGREGPPTQLLGRERAFDIALNVVLPMALAVAQIEDDPRLREQTLASFDCFPAGSENELTRYMSRVLFGRSKPRGTRAAHQQGLLHVYRRFCKDKRCAECPLGCAED